jgi:phosphatidylethanolamine-binding protein (PEBP) family uncharacterized protein
MNLKISLPVLCALVVGYSCAANALTLTSTGFEKNGLLPTTYSCDGDGVSPPIVWSGMPANTKSLVVIMDHAPGPDDLHWYWTVYNISPNVSEFKAGKPEGVLGGNSVNRVSDYAPPCSKGPGLKSYTLHLYALSAELNTQRLQSGSDKTVSESALRTGMSELILDSATLSFNYERAGTAENSEQASEKPQRDKNGKPKKGADKPQRESKTALTPPTEKNSITSEACSAILGSVSAAGFSDVAVTCDKTYAYVQSDTYPDHDLMNGITGTNEQIPVPAENYAAPIRLEPKIADAVTTIDAALGVAVNGVPIYDYSAQGELDPDQYDAKKDTLLLGQLDNCGGHAGRGDDYHYHAKPTCMIDAMPNASDATILGWGYDGFPIYGDNNPDGSTISENKLDVCNGQTDERFGYRYHTSEAAPYIVQCLVGEVDTGVLPRVSPLAGASIRSDLKPARGGVENLKHSISEEGTRTLSYEYEGVEYYTKFSPSNNSTANSGSCFDFEQKTISNGGMVETGTFCR